MTLVDTNVLLDLVTADPVWINDVVYVEFSVRFAAIETLDSLLEEARIDLAPIPRPALFLAGKAFLRYRAAGGARTGVLPDFFIGAHAAVAGWNPLTRDAARYRTYFPSVTLIPSMDTYQALCAYRSIPLSPEPAILAGATAAGRSPGDVSVRCCPTLRDDANEMEKKTEGARRHAACVSMKSTWTAS